MTARDEDALFCAVAAGLGLGDEDDLLAYARTHLRDPSQTLVDQLSGGGLIAEKPARLVASIVEQAVAAEGGDVARASVALGLERVAPTGARGDVTRPEPGRPERRRPEPRVEEDRSSEPEDTVRAATSPGGAIEAAAAHESLGASIGAGGELRGGREIGRGGIGRVMVAFDSHLGREIAVKELLPHLIQKTSDPRGPPSAASSESKMFVTRFLREARVTAQLEHPNIVPVYAIGRRKDGALYYTMKLVRGRTLFEAVRRALDLGERLRLLGHFVDLCQAIAYAHSRGVIHRDIKPQNVMLGEFGETVVLDWGLAKVRGKKDIRGRDLARNIELFRGSDAFSTAPGAAFGTPAYMSPEQASGDIEAVDEESDVFSLGVVLYEILTGRVPFEGAAPIAMIARVIAGDIPPVRSRAPDVPEELAAIAERALRRDKADRYPSAKALADDIEAYRTGERVDAYRYSTWDLLRRFALGHRAELALAAIALGFLALVALGAYRGVLEERDRALRAEDASQRSLAEAFTERARTSALGADWSSAEIYAARALGDGERPDARGMIVALTNVLRPRLLFETAAWTGCIKVAISRDARTIACPAGAEIAIYDGATGAQRTVLRVPSGWAFDVAFAPGGEVLASGGDDGVVRLFDLATSRVLSEIAIEPVRTPTGAARKLEIRSLAFSPAGDRLAVALGEGPPRVLEVASRRELARLGVEPANAVAFARDGTAVAAAGANEAVVRVFDAATGALRFALAGHERPASALAFSPDGRWLASAGRDRTVRVWNLVERRLSRLLTGHESDVHALAFAPSGRWILSASEDRTVRVWDRITTRAIARFSPHEGPVWGLALSADGRTLATASQDRTVRAWDLSGGLHEGPPERVHPGRVTAVASSSSGALATASGDGIVRVFASAGRTVPLHLGGARDPLSLAFSPDGARLAAGDGEGRVLVFDAASGHELVSRRPHAGAVRALAFSPDGASLASGGSDRAIRIYDLAAKTERVLRASDARGEVVALAFAPGARADAQVLEAAPARLVAAYSDDKSYRVFDLAAPDPEGSARAPLSDAIRALSLSPDGATLAIATRANVIELRAIDGGARDVRLASAGAAILALAYAPDGRRLASAGADKTVRVFDVSSRAELARLEVHAAAVLSVAFAPDGRLASGGEDRALHLFDLSELESSARALVSRARQDFGLELVGSKIARTPPRR